VGITLAIAGFALADKSKLAGYLFFAGLGLGSLVKGPAAVVFAGAALGPWVLIRGGLNPKNWPAQVKSLPWITGLLLMVAIVLPWYLWMEARNPGFLNYFIGTENVGRFFSKDYADKFGSGHVQPRGTAWLMLIPCVVPWSVMLIASLIEKAVKHSRKAVSPRGFIERLKHDEWLLFGFTWAISCPLLLTGMTQYTATYLMSCIPGFAFFMAVLWKRASEQHQDDTFPSPLITRIMILLLGLTLVITPSVFKATYEIHEMAFITAVTFGVLAIICAAVWKAPRSSLSGIGTIALTTALVYAILFPCADIQVSKNRSTRHIMQYAEELVGGGSLSEFKVGFAFNLPFSARFYSTLLSLPGHKVVASQLDKEEFRDAPQHVIIVRGKGAEKEFLEIAPTTQKLGQLGKWNVYRGALK
jgi:4-amino-4-deoxy-L-arabinose transferase-like glycosyltransferase